MIVAPIYGDAAARIFVCAADGDLCAAKLRHSLCLRAARLRPRAARPGVPGGGRKFRRRTRSGARAPSAARPRAFFPAAAPALGASTPDEAPRRAPARARWRRCGAASEHARFALRASVAREVGRLASTGRPRGCSRPSSTGGRTAARRRCVLWSRCALAACAARQHRERPTSRRSRCSAAAPRTGTTCAVLLVRAGSERGPMALRASAERTICHFPTSAEALRASGVRAPSTRRARRAARCSALFSRRRVVGGRRRRARASSGRARRRRRARFDRGRVSVLYCDVRAPRCVTSYGLGLLRDAADNTGFVRESSDLGGGVGADDEGRALAAAAAAIISASPLSPARVEEAPQRRDPLVGRS